MNLLSIWENFTLQVPRKPNPKWKWPYVSVCLGHPTSPSLINFTHLWFHFQTECMNVFSWPSVIHSQK